MIDINLDECTTAVDKIILNTKLFNPSFKTLLTSDFIMTYSSIQCYKSLPSITYLEIKGKNIIKIHKTIFLNLLNLISIDLSDNHLLKISKNFKLLKQLKTLKLNNNRISFIPTFIGELNQLECLSLSQNLINVIPTSIQELSKLKYLYLSSNKIENIPIELGFLYSLNVLHIDCNYFTQIPTTLCNLNQLNDLCFDWLEFVNPPYYKNIKDSIGKIIITFIIKIFQKMLKKGILYCDFQKFISEISIKKSETDINKNNINFEMYDSLLNRSGINNELKNSQFCGSSITIKSGNNNNINNKFLKIFNAIEGGYYGVIKSFLEGENVYDYLTIKNIEGRTPLSYCMTKNKDLIELFLSKIKEQKIELSYAYLFKAIKMRNPELVKKLVYIGSKVDSIDEQGKNAFHILFSVFNKNISKCILIGNFLLSFNLNINELDSEGWAPIHLAAKRGSKECLLWIIEKNKKLKKEGKEEFDFNLRGKNDWTPLHLAVFGWRIEETLILLEYGCDIFARNMEGKTPKQVGISNYVFSKLLTHYETVELNNKYIFGIKSIEFDYNKKRNLTKIKNKNVNQNEDEVSSSFYDENIIINNSVTIISNLYKRKIKKDKKKNLEDLKKKK
jgi:ankyrin repeat protein